MKTTRFTIKPEEVSPTHSAIVECAAILRRGGLVAIPTETVYGLAGNALDPAAIARIFEAKQRPAWDPLIVHVSNLEMIKRIAAGIPELAQLLMERFWPGPLTLLLKKSEGLPSSVTAGRDSVAIRMPSHPIARTLIEAADLPLAAPSANRFGHSSPTTAEHVLADLDGRIEAVLDGGKAYIGVESTVLDVLRTPPRLLRPGGITREELETVIGPIELYTQRPQIATEPQSSPGLAERHYAPRAKVILVDGSQEALGQQIRVYVASEGERGDYVAVMAPQGWIHEEMLASGGLVIFDWGTWGDWSQLAQNLFAGLRYLDKPGVSVILCPLPPDEGLGLALRDRLTRAAR